MKNLRPQILLAVLVGAVPLAVLCAGAVAFLLLRAGYGFFIWAVLPFLGVTGGRGDTRGCSGPGGE